MTPSDVIDRFRSLGTTDVLRVCRAVELELELNALAPSPAAESEREWPGCRCVACLKLLPPDGNPTPHDRRIMVVCEFCGNKRCPHAADHRYTCTGSNEPNQTGTVTPAAKGVDWKYELLAAADELLEAEADYHLMPQVPEEKRAEIRDRIQASHTRLMHAVNAAQFPPSAPAAPEVERPGRESESLRDELAMAAMQSLILKVPLHDRQGEHGIHSPEIADIQQVRLDIAESAYDYADAMRTVRTQQRAAVDAPTPGIEFSVNADSPTDDEALAVMAQVARQVKSGRDRTAERGKG